eukprot:6471537-Prymnesium_polylepis.1
MGCWGTVSIGVVISVLAAAPPFSSALASSSPEPHSGHAARDVLWQTLAASASQPGLGRCARSFVRDGTRPGVHG